MSANVAYALPERSPQPAPGEKRRHIEIVTSREQRLARPRLAYSLVIVVGLFAVLATQLLLSIALADGAYQISALQAEQKELARSHQSVAEELHVLGSPQSLAARAESLGMVSNNSAAYLSLADGKVLGSPKAAKSGAGSAVGTNGSLLVANSLLDGVPASMAAQPTNGDAHADTPEGLLPTGSMSTGSTSPTSPTTTGIPGPSTR